MKLEPINLSLEEVATEILAGRHVMVKLEPGDATRYEFFVIPVVNPNEPTGAFRGVHLYYAFANNSTVAGEGMACVLYGQTGPYAFEILANEYSREVLAAFHNALMEALS